MTLGINYAQIFENELKDIITIYEFLAAEGLSIVESIKLMLKMNEIYQEMTLFNRVYSISEISLIVIRLLNDNFFDNNFIICLLEEASNTTIGWGQLYSKLCG